MKSFTIPFYRQIVLRESGLKYGVYVMHYAGTNHMIIGAFVESLDGLQRTHIPGPLIHHEHVDLYADWLRDKKNHILFVEKADAVGRKSSLVHPFSSSGEPHILKTQNSMQLGLGKYFEVSGLTTTTAASVYYDYDHQIAAALVEGRNVIWGDPIGDLVSVLSLADGRFCWINYDEAISKLRFGMGFFDAANEPVFGATSYVLDQDDYVRWAALHFSQPDIQVHFYGLPPRWPGSLSPNLAGPVKAGVAVEVVRLGDKVWNT